MNAKEMFEKLGYVNVSDNVLTPIWVREHKGGTFNYDVAYKTTLEFSFKSVNVKLECQNYHGLCVSEVKAIAKQMEELGWVR